MDSIVRGLTVYLFLLLVFRLAGKRNLSQMTTFDLVLLLIISEVTQQAMVGNDRSLTNSFLLIMTLVGASVFMSWLKQKSPQIDKILEATPVVVIENGHLYKDRMEKDQVDQGDILEAARELQGLERLEQIKHAVVEKSGAISIIPK